MQQPLPTISAPQNSKPPRGVLHILLRWSLRIMGIAATVLLLGIGSLIIISQTQAFRAWLKPWILNLANSNLQARIECDDIQIDLLKGLILTNVHMLTAGDTLANVRQIAVYYDIQPLLNNSITITSLVLDSPSIKLLRLKNGKWNTDYIALPSPPDTLPGKPFDWHIYVGSLEICNGTVQIKDSTNLSPMPGQMNFGNLHLDSVNMQLHAQVFPGIHRFDASIKSLGFLERASGLQVQNLGLDINNENTGLTIKNLSLKTPRTNLNLAARLQGIDILGTLDGEQIFSAPLSLQLQATPFNPDDLRFFLPYIGFYGSYTVDIDAGGSLNNLDLQTLEVHTKASSLSIKGRLKGLDHTERLSFDAKILNGSHIIYEEFRRLTPILGLPPLPFLGNVQFNKAHVKGMPSDSLDIQLDANTGSGAVQGGLILFLKPDTLTYRGDLSFAGLNLGTITGSQDLQSNLNLRCVLDGKGTTLQELETEAMIEATASTLGEYSMHALQLKTGIHQGGDIRIDTLNLVLRPGSTDDDFEMKESSALRCSGSIDLRPANPRIMLEADMQALEPAALFKTKKLPTYLDGTLVYAGTGIHPDSAEGSLHMHIRRVMFNDRALRPLTLNVDVHRKNAEERTAVIESSLFRVKAEGIFRFEPLVNTIDHMVSSVIVGTERKIRSIRGDSLHILPLMPRMDSTNIHAKLSAVLRDFSPINLFLEQGINVSGEALLNARIDADPLQTTMTVDTVHITNGAINAKEIDTESSPFSMRGRVITVKDTTNGRRILKGIRLQSSCQDMLHVNKLSIQKPLLRMRYEQDSITMYFRGDMGELFSGAVRARGILNDTLCSFSADSVHVRYGPMAWDAIQSLYARISPAGLRIDSMSFRRNGAEIISARGHISSNRFDSVDLYLKGFPLKDIQIFPFMPDDIKDVLRTLKGRLSTVHITADGPFDNPSYSCNGIMDSIIYNDVLIGNQTLDLNHKDSVLTGEIYIINPRNPQKRALEIGIDQIPLNLALEKSGKFLRENDQIIVTARAQGLSMATLAPFIPGINKLQGLADAEIAIEGYAPDKVNYGGKAIFRDVSFILQATNIRYIASGTMKLRNATARLDSIRLRNDRADLPGGEAIITGQLNLRDVINIQSFDLNIVSQQLLVLSDASEQTMPTMYGRFVIASGQKGPMHFYGTFSKPFLRGDIQVLQASITMPPDQEQIAVTGTRYTYLSAQESAGIKKGIQDGAGGAAALADSLLNLRKQQDKRERQDSVRKEQKDINDELRRKRSGFHDLLDYDVNVYMPGKFRLKMLLGTFEEIRAFVQPVNRLAALRFQKFAFDAPRLFGDIQLLDGSEYKFLKVFQASGKLIFNTGQIDNPSLDLLAVYKGQTRYDNEIENFRVIMKITGTKKLPVVVITWERNGIEAVGDSAQIRSDALMKLIVGRTQQELFGRQGGIGTKGLGNEISNSLSAAASQLFSGLLEGTGLLTNATISLQEGLADLSQARLNLSGQLFQDVAWRAAGTLGDLTGNYEFSVDVPLTILGDYEGLRNLLLQLTRASAPANAILTRQQKEWEMKVSWRYAF
jgi:hypothetical protein